MKRRVFIAIDLPQEVKARLETAISQWHWLPIRWLKPEFWHITLIPPLYLEDEEIRSLQAVLEHTVLAKPFQLYFSRLMFAPPGIAARMIWLEGTTPKELSDLKKKLEDIMIARPYFFPIRREARPFKLHVTLARFQPGDLKDLQEKVRMLGEVDLKCSAQGIVLMESHLKSEGAEYELIASVLFS